MRASHAEEAQVHLRLMDDALGTRALHILELGSGGGQLATHFDADRTVVLSDLSERMLDESRRHNPSKIHVLGDMRTMRLERTFDAVLLHDAVMYLTSPDDLRATFETAATHLKPGGVFLVVPDVVRETFEEGSVSGGSLGTPAAQLLEWHWDPNPEDHTYRVDMCLMLRHADGRMETVHEHHEMGLFDRKTICDLLRASGFELVQGTVWEAVDISEFFIAIKHGVERTELDRI